MTYNTESSTGVDDRDRDDHPDREAGHDSEHDPRDPVYSRDSSDVSDRPFDAEEDPSDRTDTNDADDVRDEAYHAGDSPPATSTSATEAETEADREARFDDEADREARFDDEADREAQFDAVARSEDAGYDAERDTERNADYDAERDGDYEAAHNRVDGEDIAVPAGPVEANPPTVVAVAPVNAAVPTETGRDEADAREAETDRDAVDAVNADAAAGTVYQSDQEERDERDARDEQAEYDEQRADNGPIVTETDTQDETPRNEMMPGGVEPAPVAAFWNESDAQGIRDRWRELQLRFIDDPETVTGEAERLVEEAVANLSAALSKARQDLGDWRNGQNNDTERLRAAVRSYRDFLDRILGL